jgi:hypothetical protein
MTPKRSKFQPKPGDVVLVQTESKNRGTWPLEIIEETYPGKDNVIRGVHASEDLKELSCDAVPEVPILNPDTLEFESRPRRDAATAAKLRIQQIDAADHE